MRNPKFNSIFPFLVNTNSKESEKKSKQSGMRKYFVCMKLPEKNWQHLSQPIILIAWARSAMRANGFRMVSTSGNVHRITVFRQRLVYPLVFQ